MAIYNSAVKKHHNAIARNAALPPAERKEVPELPDKIPTQPISTNKHYKIVKKPNIIKRFFGKKTATMDYDQVINPIKAPLVEMRKKMRYEKIAPVIAEDLLLFLIINKHPRYPNEFTKIDHMHKLAQKWVKDNGEDINDAATMHRYFDTINVAISESETTYHSTHLNLDESAWPTFTERLRSVQRHAHSAAGFLSRVATRCATRLQRTRLPRTPYGQHQLGSKTIAQGATQLAALRAGNISALVMPSTSALL
jgi:hypothetical protein